MTSSSPDRPDEAAADQSATAPSAQGADGDSGYQPPAQAQSGQSGYQPPPAQPGYQQEPGQYAPPPQQGGYQQGGYEQPAGQYGQGQPPAYPNQPGYPPQPYGAPPVAGQQPMSPSDERLWATLSHISIPFFTFIGPLIVYLVFKDRSAFLKDQGAEALNFSILYSIVYLVGAITTAFIIGLVILPVAFIGALVLCIMAAIAANKGELYRYPVNWRLIK
jgi:uncharacterized Tic20 family protein